MSSGHGFHPFGGRVSRHFGDSLTPKAAAYLSYHDVRLTKEDVDCIAKGDWLTDNAISFYEEYLEREKLPEHPTANISLLRPSMSFMLSQTPDPSILRSALPDFTRTTHIFLPINDCTNPSTPEGGSHWSLLLISLLDGVAFHYDSLRYSNRHVAATTTQRFAALVRRPLRHVEMETSPQQNNSSDCGVFVCETIRVLLLSRLLTGSDRTKVSMGVGRTELDASAFRKHMIRLIERFRRQGERSRSRSRSPFARGSDDWKSPLRVGD